VCGATLHCRSAEWALRLPHRRIRGLGRVRRCVHLPLLELSRQHWLGILAMGRDRAREVQGDQGRGIVDAARRGARGSRDAVRSVLVAGLLDEDCARGGVRSGAVRDARRRADPQADGPYVRRFQGSVVRDPGRPAPARRVSLVVMGGDGFIPQFAHPVAPEGVRGGSQPMPGTRILGG